MLLIRRYLGTQFSIKLRSLVLWRCDGKRWNDVENVIDLQQTTHKVKGSWHSRANMTNMSEGCDMTTDLVEQSHSTLFVITVLSSCFEWTEMVKIIHFKVSFITGNNNIGNKLHYLRNMNEPFSKEVNFHFKCSHSLIGAYIEMNT